MKRMNTWTMGLLALSLSGVALPAAATATIWGTPTAANCAATQNSFPASAIGTQGSTVYLNCAPPDIGGTRLNYQAWSNTGLAGVLAQAYVGAYSGGLGVTSNQGPNSAAVSGGNLAGQREVTNQNDYAMDNSGNFEMLLLRFSDATTNVSTPVYLNSLTIAGFSGVDSDLTVLAYGGTGSPNLVGNSYSNLLASGWNLVGNYADVVSNTATAVNSSSLSSSYWLIGAYNSAFGSGANLSTGNDYVRLLSVTTSGPVIGGSAPEPSTILLIAAALVGLTAMRRRQAA